MTIPPTNSNRISKRRASSDFNVQEGILPRNELELRWIRNDSQNSAKGACEYSREGLYLYWQVTGRT